MKHFTLVKHHPCTQLAHLYEHLFIATVADQLYRHGQYKLLDYALNGATYDSGVIIISAECYTKTSAELLQDLATMKTDFGEDPFYLPISRALSQITAEESGAIFIGDVDTIIGELKALDDQPWQELDSVELLPKVTHTDKKLLDLMYVTDQPGAKPRKIKLQLQFSDPSIELRILWRELAHFLNLSIGQRVCQEFGAYFAHEDARDSANSTTVISTFLINPRIMPITQIEEITASVKYTLETITKLEVMQRFANYLSLASYSSNPHAAPDEDRLLREFGAILGSAGWKKIASVENLTKVLQATQISLRQHGSRQVKNGIILSNMG